MAVGSLAACILALAALVVPSSAASAIAGVGGAGADIFLGGPGVDVFGDVESGVDSPIQDQLEMSVVTDDEGLWSMTVPKGVYRTAFAAQGYQGEWFAGAEHLTDAWLYPTSDVASSLITSLDASLVRDPSQDLPGTDAEPESPVVGEPGDVLATYGYDGEGLRLWERQPGVGETRYGWDRSSSLALPAAISGAKQGGGETNVVSGPAGAIWVDPSGGGRVFLHTDAVGSITAATNSAGAVVSRVSYTPFGEVASVEGSAPVVAFTGQIFDAETGLYYLRARYYDPGSGRFTQPDPAGWVPGANHESTYLYGAGSPLTNVDPTGLRIERAERQAAAAEAARVRNDPLGSFKSWITQPHNALDVLGMVPIVGEAFDLANAALYLAEGNWSMAALSALAIVPIAGDALAKGTKYADEALAATGLVAKNADSGLKSLDTVTHTVDNARTPLQNGDTLGSGVKSTATPAAPTRPPTKALGGGMEAAIEVHPFAGGATHITTTRNLQRFPGSPTFGGPDGLFVAPTRQINDLLASGASRSQIEVALGLNKGALRGGDLVRVDVTDPFERGLRLPDPKLGNIHHRPGTGLTTGNIHEAVVDSPSKNDPRVLFSVLTGRP